MKTSVSLSFAILLLLTSSAYAQEQRGIGLEKAGASSNRRIALVIGNGAYPTSPLKNPPNDATDMAKALSNVGFTVDHGENLTQRQMKALIREFGQKLKAGGQGLFYYAGHGIQLKGRNYLIPVDAEIASEADVEDQGVDATLLLALMDEAGNGLNVVILDACRNNPFARSYRSSSNGLAQVDAPTGTLVAYSTAPGKVARDGVGRNGAYTAELLKQMRVPGLPIEEVMKRVRASLKQLTNGEQVPWETSSLVGNFYLNKAAGAASMAANPAVSETTSGATANPAAVEQEYWETIKDSREVEDFRDYLKEYPAGLHAAIARSNLRRLEAAGKASSDAAANTGDVSAAGWLRHNSTEGRYSVLVPREVTFNSQQATAATGEKFTQYITQTSDADGYYMISYFDYTPNMVFSLDKGRDGMIKAVNGTLLSEQAITFGGYSGRELKVSATNQGVALIIRARMYNIGTRVYVLQHMFINASDTAANAVKTTRFFDSFKVTLIK